MLFKLRLKYPTIVIKGKTTIERACQIISEDGAELILENVYISSGTFIRAVKNSSIQIKESFIGRNCSIVALESIQIDEGCEIAEMVVIRDQNHKHELNGKRISELGYDTSPIKIGKNVWVGCKVTILKGVEVGSNSVLGAHSLVNKNVPESSVAFGIPVKIRNH